MNRVLVDLKSAFRNLNFAILLSPLLLALCLVSALFFALCVPAQAQQPGKIPRIGYVSGSDDLNNPGPKEAFRRGLQELGYVEGEKYPG
jgi:hypothetical protein